MSGSIRLPFWNDWQILRDFRRHKGEQCVLLATGPSLNEIDIKLLENHPFVCGTNGAYVIRQHFRYYFISNWFYRRNYMALQNLNVERWYFREDLRQVKGQHPLKGIYVKIDKKSLKNKIPMKKFRTNLFGTLSWGPTVLLDIAIPVCLWMGFSEIILCGADYPLGKYQNFYSNDPNAPPQGKPVENEMLMAHHGFEVMLAELNKRDSKVRFYNCSPLSELNCFEKKPLEQVLKCK